jgi:hypothetical protein
MSGTGYMKMGKYILEMEMYSLENSVNRMVDQAQIRSDNIRFRDGYIRLLTREMSSISAGSDDWQSDGEYHLERSLRDDIDVQRSHISTDVAMFNDCIDYLRRFTSAGNLSWYPNDRKEDGPKNMLELRFNELMESARSTIAMYDDIARIARSYEPRPSYIV